MKNRVTIWLIFICLTNISAFGECIGGNTDYNDSKVFYDYTPDLTTEEPPVEPMNPPTKPIVKNIHFDPLVYDWEIDSIYGDSKLCFDIECENATGLEVHFHGREDFWNSDIMDNIWYEGVEVLEINNTNHYEFTYVELGDIIKICAYNKKGVTFSDPISVNNYLEDPAITARLEELRNITTNVDISISDLYSLKNEITFYRNHIYINSDHINSVDVYNLGGDKILKYERMNNILDTSNLAKGVYIVAYTTYQNEKLTLKYIKQ